MRKLNESFTLWLCIFITAILLTCGTAKSAEVGIVTVEQSVTCQQAEKDFDVTSKRWRQVKNLRDVTKDSSMQLVLDAELKALIDLGGRILMWKSENCRDV